MTQLRRHVLASTGALLLLATIQIVLESSAATLVYRGQILPAYGFFPTQIYDFLAKLRWFAGEAFAHFTPLAWLPELPVRFRAPTTVDHVGVALELLPVGISMALLLGVLGGIVGAAVAAAAKRKSPPTLRGYLWVWAGVGLAVHAAAAIPPLSLDEHPTLRALTYRTRSFVVDGTAVALGVFVASVALARAMTPLLARARAARGALAAAVVALAAASALLGRSPEADSAETPHVAVRSDAPAAKPGLNVVLISLDSLRADHVGCYGYERPTTPAIDKLAAEGVRFANAISTSSWTLPTHLTMFTSRYQISHGVVHETLALSPAIPTIAEVLEAQDYVTAGFVSAPYVAGHYGYARAMDVYEDISAAYGHRSEARSAVVSPRLEELVLPWLEKHTDKPFFLFVHNFDIHYDYIPPPPYDTMFDPDYRGKIDGTDFIERGDVHRRMDGRDLEHILALYDGEIRFTDDHVGRILRKLDELGLRDRTLVLLVSDHGEEFFEHGNKGHHRTVYEEVLRIPFVMRLPGGASAGTVVDEQVSLVDLMPTILDVLHVPAPPGMEGVSVLPLLDGERGGREAVYAEFFDKRGFNVQVARRTPGHKVIQHFNRITHPRSDPLELYDLAADPAEKRDVAGQRSADARGELQAMSRWLNEQWTAHRSAERAAGGSSHVEIDDATMERLRSLGYVGD